MISVGDYFNVSIIEQDGRIDLGKISSLNHEPFLDAYSNS
jgi:hypothetical protein